MQNKLFYLLLAVIVISCNSGENKNTAQTTTSMDASFDQFKNEFIERMWVLYPDAATGVGYHKYDSVLFVPNKDFDARQLAFAQSNLDSLKTFNLDQLSDLNKIDYHLIENSLVRTQWQINSLKSGEWNPADYNVCGSFAFILNENYDKLDNRLQSLYLKMANVPAFYEAAKQNLKNPSAEHTQLAIDQNLGGVAVFDKDIIDSVKISGLDDATKQNIIARAKDASKAVHDYATYLKGMKNDTPRSFRLGKELYPDKFKYEIESDYTPEQIYDSAVVRKNYLHGEMARIAEQLWPTYFGSTPKPDDKLVLIKKMIDTLSVKHAKPEEFQATIEKQLPELVEFIKEKNLIYIDPSKPLKVRKEPGYMAGVAGASISSPGPYDKNGNTYYNVGSLEGWSKERSESYLREYNHYILQILNIHEAIPGHYTQLVYSNNSPSIIKSIFGNGAMIEGWAVYGELMMLENGYGNDKMSKSTEATPEMWLMYYKWNLRAVCNTILDIGVHSRDMTKEQALDLLVREAFQQQAEAEGKWKRVQLTNVQLCSYYTGFKEIYDLREAYKVKLGDKFNLKEFHEKFLSYGSSPVRYIRQMMLMDGGEK